jgi:hypothetical protein
MRVYGEMVQVWKQAEVDDFIVFLILGSEDWKNSR